MRPAYLDDQAFADQQTPSIELIRRRCRAIQATWSRREERFRRLSPHLDLDIETVNRQALWTPPVVVTVDLLWKNPD